MSAGLQFVMCPKWQRLPLGVKCHFLRYAWRVDHLCGLRERKKRRTRSALVDAALELFERKGFEATTVEEIAAAADVSPRTFFRYFPAKEGVVLAVQDEEFELVLAELERGPRDLRAALLAVIGAGVDSQFRRVQELLAVTPALRATNLERSMEQEKELVARLLPADADQAARLRVRVLVAMTCAALRVAIENWLSSPDTSCAEHMRAALAVLDQPSSV